MKDGVFQHDKFLDLLDGVVSTLLLGCVCLSTLGWWLARGVWLYGSTLGASCLVPGAYLMPGAVCCVLCAMCVFLGAWRWLIGDGCLAAFLVACSSLVPSSSLPRSAKAAKNISWSGGKGMFSSLEVCVPRLSLGLCVRPTLAACRPHTPCALGCVPR